MPERHRNARLLHRHNFQSQHVSPQQCYEINMDVLCRKLYVPRARHGPTQAGRVSLLGCETKSTVRGSLLFAHRKRSKLTALEKSSHFLSPFSKQNNLQDIQGSVVLAVWLFYTPACDSSPLCIFCIYPQQTAFLIAP